MKRLLAPIVTLALAVCGAVTAQADLLTNGNLDRTHAVEITTGFFLPQPTDWTSQGSRSISGAYKDYLSSEPWAGPAPTPVTTDGNLNPPFPEGFGGPDGGVFFKAFTGNATDGSATAHLYQDNAATAGLTYTLTGWAGAEANYLAGKSVFAIDFLDSLNGVLASTEVDLVSAGLFVANGQAFNYKQFTVSATAPVNTVSVRSRVSMIEGLSNPAGGGQAFVVDDFTLVPEPTGVVLGLTGLLALLAIRPRKSGAR